MCKAFFTGIFLLSAAALPAQQSKTDTSMLDKNHIIARNARLTQISNQFRFTEGPATDNAGNVYFTDQPNNRIWKYSVGDSLSLFMEPSGRANGMFFDRNGRLIACADENNELWAISLKSKTYTVLVSGFEGKKLNGPNDVWASPAGHLYFTDPYYQRDYWTRKESELDGHKVYILKIGAKKPVIADDQLVKPNGIIGSADGKNLFVADIDDNKTYKYDIAADGSLTNRRLFCGQGSDGMTIDTKGNIYLTGKGVTVYDAGGKKIAHIPVDEEWTGNVCFAGKNRDLLFITASKSVYTLQMNVRGQW
ncbi:MAG: SMP-30/gluconolactonase/LRE family protein [Mucilaginibacter polytrichastri]|nr:SMP-30/gluconolactonase/LRE family protein [Mucilaginibacter polytrichastri]